MMKTALFMTSFLVVPLLAFSLGRNLGYLRAKGPREQDNKTPPAGNAGSAVSDPADSQDREPFRI